MNPEQRIWSVAEMYLAASRKHDGKLHLCYWEKKLQVLPVGHTNKPHDVFHSMRSLDVWKGLPAGVWNELKLKLANFFKDKR